MELSIWQVYYDRISKKGVIPNLKRYNNEGKETVFLENEVIIDIYNNYKKDWEDSDYVGVISWRFQQKTGLDISDINKAVITNKDAYSFNPWRMKKLPSLQSTNFSDVNEISKILDSYNILPFKLESFDPGDGFKVFCNYWICKPEIFEDYVKNYLIPTVEWLQECKDKSLIKKLNKVVRYRTGLYPVHPFLLECLFEAYIKHKGCSYECITNESKP